MKKRLLSIFLCIAMLLSVVPARAFAEEGPAAYDVTDDLSELISDIEIIGLDVDEDGNYQVHANQPYSLKVTFKEKTDLEMDMTGSVHYALPRGLVSPNESNTIDIGVVDGYYKSITHDATILDNVLTITWNQDDENFPDLARAHYVEFTVNVRGTFDGSEGEIVIGDEEERRIVVDNTGSVTVVKNVTGLKPGVSLSAEEQEAMTFELVNSTGTVVKTFTYADLVRGTISFDKMKPGAYTVRETNHPDPANYTFDTADSVLSANGTLIPGGSLTLTLSNDYDYDTGALELSKDITVQNWDGTTTVPQAVTNGISYTITGPDGYKNTVYYTDFVNGKLTLSDLEVGDYTVTEKSTVPGYTWTYTVDGATPDYPIATVTVTKNGTATVAYANNYVQQTGNVTIVKTATGGVTIPEGTQFKVTYPDGTTTKTFTYAQMTGGTYTLSNVPLGTYKVEEVTSTAQVNNYSLTVTGTGDVKLEIADATATATIVNKYSPLGSLQVLKTVAGDLAASDLTVTQQKNIKFTIKNSANTTVKVLSLYDILQGNNTVSDLPVGTYTVTESNPAVDGYTVVADPSSKKVTVNVTVGETATASFTNTYTKKVYTLTVNKTFGENSFYTADTLPANFKSGTTFTIKDSSGTVVKTCTYEELATAMNGIELPGPGPYTVSESNPRVPGIGVYTTVSKNGGTAASGTSASITLEDHQPATVTFENNYVSEGKIKGEKLIEGLPPFETEALKNEIKFTIYQKQNGTFVMYKENISIAELASGITVPAGEYYVQETGSITVQGFAGPDITTWIEDGEASPNRPSTDYFTVVQGGTTNIHFKNFYYVGVGGGVVGFTKYARGLEEIGTEEEILVDADFDVRNTAGALLYQGITFLIEEQIGNSWYEYATVSLESMLNGKLVLRSGHYRVFELGADVEGYSVHADYVIKNHTAGGSDQTGGNGVEFSMRKDDDLQITVYNVYTKLGNLKITKTITGDLYTTYNTYPSEAFRKGIKFIVEGPFGFYDEFTFDDICADSTDGRKYSYGEKVYTNIPVGTYTVTEIPYNASNYNLTHATVSPANGVVTVPVGGTATVDFTNEYNRKVGDLTVQKVLAGEYPETMTDAQKKAMKFEVINQGDGKVYGTVTYDQFVGGAYTFPDLPTGNYYVRETIGGILTDDYVINVTGTGLENKVTITNAVTKTITVTNTFQKTGALKLVKTFDGATLPAAEKATIAFKYWKIDDDGNKIAGTEKTVSYSSFTNDAYLIKNLEPGRYVIAELDNETTYLRTTTVQVDDESIREASQATVEITFGETVVATFDNTYEEVSSLTVTKAIGGVLSASTLTAAQKAAISFTVKNSAGEPVGTFTYAEMTSGSKSFTNLTPGVYTVEEVITDPDHSLFGDYTCLTQYRIGTGALTNATLATVTLVHGRNTVAFTNTYNRITPLHINKTSSDSYVGLVEKNGAKYPVWRFTLSLTNLSNLTTLDGATTISDVFDTQHADWFRLATAEEVAAALGTASAQNVSIAAKDSKPAPSVRFVEATNSIIVSDVTAQTSQKCDITYYLIAKDYAAVEALNTPSEQYAPSVAHSFLNTVTYKPMPYKNDTETAKASYVYAFTAVTKNITNVDAQGNLYDTIGGEKVFVNYADYSVVMNPNGISVGTQPTITAVDTFSANQTVLLSSIKVSPSDINVDISLDNTNHTLTLVIPNGTPVTVSYRSNIAKTDETTVTLTNGVILEGFGDEVQKIVTRPVGGEGSGEIYSVTVIKVDALNNNIKLPGVQFGLYDGVTDERLTGGSTNENGQILFKYWGETGSIQLEHDYYFKEEGAVAGYSLDSRKYSFRVTKNETPGIDSDGTYILASGGELIITNQPVVADLSVTKSFNEWGKQNAFTFKLEGADEDTPMPAIGGDVAVATKDNPTGVFGTIRYAVTDADFAGGKTVTYHYTIQEIVNAVDKVPGITYDTAKHPVTVVISDTNMDGIREVSVVYGESDSSLTVTNEYAEGSLKISKALFGNDIDPDKKFEFTIKLDAAVYGTFSGVVFAGGEATIELKGGESKTIEGLPNGVNYTVTETDYTAEGYLLTGKTGDTGVISKTALSVAAFENTRDTFGDLIVKKTVTGNAGDKNKDFYFTVVLGGTPAISGTYGDMTFTAGIATFSLKDGQQKKATGLPHGTTYTVLENNYAEAGYVTSKEGDQGVIIGNEEKIASFTNDRNTFGDLKVTKTVTGNACDKDKTFRFTVTLTDKTITGTYGEMEFVKGVAIFALKDGETKTAEDLPNGVGYTVAETDYTNDGYTTEKTGDEGTIEGDKLKTAAFTNNRDAEGSLTITKTLAGNDTDPNKSFNFTITLNQALNGTYSGVEFKNGVANISLKGGESKTIEGLPNGCGYTVAEESYQGAGYITTKSGEIGTISELTPAMVYFTNTRDTFGDLTVKKVVTGNDCDKTKQFEFTVTLDKALNGTYGQMTFTDGVATFVLANGESKTAKDLPNGIGYTVTEKSYAVDGYVTEKTGDTGTIDGDAAEDAVATFTNTRDTFGDLTVEKTVTGNDCDKTKKFEFTVTLDKALTGTYGEMTFTNGVATFTLADGESKTATDLPNGVGYTVTEKSYTADGYVTEKTGDTGVIDGDAAKDAVASFTNTRDTFGDLIVEKTVTGNDCDLNKAFFFTVTLDKELTGTYGEMTFTAGVATFSLKGGETKTAKDLPNGVGYTVTETDYSGEGYVTEKTGETGTIDGDAAATAKASFTNTRDTFGDLTVEKTVTGNAADKTKKFEFTVTLDKLLTGTYGEMTFENGVATFTLADGESKTATDLPNGTGYTVTEKNYATEGYVTEKTGDTGTIDGDAAVAAKASFKNNRDADGSLTVTKVLTGNDTDPAKEFTFTIELGQALNGTYSGVKFTDGKATVVLVGGQSKTISGLPNGTGYTVTEADYTNDGYALVLATGTVGTISETAIAVASFTNERNTYGDLIVKKVVAGNAASTTKEFEFTVTLGQALTGTYGEMTFENGVATFVLKDGETKTAEDLPNGIGYTVTEKSYATDGYTTSKVNDHGTIVGDTQILSTFTNTRNANGSLTVKKILAGNDTDPAKEFTFTIELDAALTGTYSGVAFTNGVATVVLKGGESKTIDGLPNGTGYTVTEADYTNAGYELTVATGTVGKISETVIAVASFTNERNTYGDLIVKKTVAGNAASTTKEFEFTVTLNQALTGTYGEMTFTDGIAAFVLKDGETKTAEDLPNGIEYTVTEKSYTADGYTTSKVNDHGTIVGGTQILSTFTNTRNADGSLTVTKILVGNDTDPTKKFTFTIKLGTALNGTYSGVKFTDGIATVELVGGESKTIEGLPNGTDYTVTEADYTNDGYELTAATGTVGTISETAVSIASFTNTRNTYGDLTVTKTVTGNACDKTKEFEFTVTLTDTSINGTYGDMTFENGVAAFVLKDGESKTAKDLPNGTEYTVTEADYTRAGYITTKTGDQGTIDDEKPATAAFKNNRDANGTLTITKTLAGNDTDPKKEFTFTIKLDAALTGTYGDAVFTNGVATVVLVGGETKTVSDLPNGCGYTVTEADYTKDGYELTLATGTVGTISETVVAAASFTNTRNTYGDLTVTKTVTGNACDKTKEFEFTVTLTDTSINGTYGDMTFENGVAAFVLKDGESKTAKDLPNGTEYTVVEKSYQSEGYETTKTGDQGIIDDEKPATAAFTNNRDAVGTLTITKVLTGNDTDSKKEFTFTIMLNAALTGTYGDAVFTNGVATIVLKGGETKTVIDLPNGTIYTVTEADYKKDGYELVLATGTTGTISETVVAAASFTNNRDTYGDLTVTKKVDGNACDKDKEFTFRVELKDTSINGTYGDMTFENGIAEFVLKDGESKTAKNLPNGTEYKVTETDYSEAGYVTGAKGDEGVIDDEKPAFADFTNTRDAEGSLTITKVLTGNDTDPDKLFSFTIKLNAALTKTFSGVEFVNGEATVTLKGGESKTIDGLPNGTEYTVTEADYTKEGYELVLATGTVGTISELYVSVATFINNRDTFGDLTVRKTISGNDQDPDRAFEFTVTLDTPDINGIYGDMEFINGVAVFTLKGGESATATDLPNGVGYTVTEEDCTAEQYFTSRIGEDGKIVGDDEQVISYNNYRDTFGDLTVTKKVTGNAGDKQKEFSFTVVLTDTSINGLYGDMEFVDGVATFTLKHGESMTAIGLPNGCGYTVTEEDYTAEEYITSMTGDEGTIVGNEIQKAEFINRKNRLPETGGNNIALWVSLMGISGITMIGTAIRGKRKEEEE